MHLPSTSLLRRMRAAPMLGALVVAAALVADGCGRAERAPHFVDIADAPRELLGTPATRPEDWRLMFVDMETTGLVPGWHEMIDVGLVLTDLSGVPTDSLYLRIQPGHPERLSPRARELNGFDAPRWRREGALRPAAAADSIILFRERAAAGKSVALVAINIAFSTAFLDGLFRDSDRSWRELFYWQTLDVPSMAWALGHREVSRFVLPAVLGVPGEPEDTHQQTGGTGASLASGLYRALLAERASGARAPTSVDGHASLTPR
jgi:hypothetical protein